MKEKARLVAAFAAVVVMMAAAAHAADRQKIEPAKTTQPTSTTVATRKADATVNSSTYSDAAKSVALTGEQINWQVISSGGGSSSSASFSLEGTVGQAAVGFVSSTSFGVHQGYWQAFGGGSCCTLRGDVDGSGAINVGDLTYLVAFIFKGGPAAPCPEHADLDASGAVNVSDLTYMVAFVFKGGPSPAAC